MFCRHAECGTREPSSMRPFRGPPAPRLLVTPKTRPSHARSRGRGFARAALQAAPTPCAVTALLAVRPLIRGVADATPPGLIPRDHKEEHRGPRIIRTHRQCRQA